jgi:hypothetical protein
MARRHDKTLQGANKMKIGFLGLLTLIFVIAKIAGYITWSWWLVFSPVFVFLFIVAIIITLVVLAEMGKSKWL